MTRTLDEAQSRAVSAEPDQTTIVTAGPGAGKSHVVGELSRRLVVDQGLWPDEVLVISFSRAAVKVVNDRTADIVDQGSRISAATIDSLAARIVQERGDGEVEFTSFDKTVREAEELLHQVSDHSFVTNFSHVIVDEVQDVVGLRAEFLISFLRMMVDNGAGFTLLGDPLQSLYDFQLPDGHLWTCEEFLATVDSEFAPAHIQLTGDYRGLTRDARIISSIRTELVSLDDDHRLRQLRATGVDLAPLGPLNDDALETIGSWPGHTALLCDTNARAGLVADELARAGITPRLTSSAEDVPLPAWIAQCLSDAPAQRISYGDFLQRAQAVGLDDHDAAWRALTTIADSDRVLDLSQFVSRLTRGTVESLPPEARPAIQVSTVHRAKGLEFDNVVLIDPDDWWRPDEDHSRASRMLYVALSRAHSRVSYARGCTVRGWFKSRIGSGGTMWMRGPRGRRGGINGLLMEPTLARALGPSTDLSSAMIGHTVSWEAGDHLEDVDGDMVPTWVATASGVPVARTGLEFGRVLMTRSRGRLPSLTGGWVERLETSVGPPVTTNGGRHGLWLGARVSGVVDLEWR